MPELRPNDSEAQDLASRWKAAGGSGDAARSDPLERIARTLTQSPSARRRSCWTQMEAARLAALTRMERSGKLAAQAMIILTAACCWRPSGSTNLPLADDGTGRGPRRPGRGPRAHRRHHGGAQRSRCGAGTCPSVDAYLVMGGSILRPATWTRRKRSGEALRSTRKAGRPRNSSSRSKSVEGSRSGGHEGASHA